MDRQKPSGKPFDISKWEVLDAWKKVKANKGAPGVDGVALGEFEKDLGNNLYKIWNRMSSGSYFPPPVKAVEIPKPHGSGTRILGVPTIADRVAQTVVAARLEKAVEPVFHPDSYGYRPGRSPLHAVAACRKRCWKYGWVIDLDVQKFFDSVPWNLIVKAVEAHTGLPWVLLYVKRWLAAPIQQPDGTVLERDRGTPQGSAVSPVLANLFMHYAFDTWLAREFPGVEFERFADDAVVHCATRYQAQKVLAAAGERMEQVGLRLYPAKTRIVYCKDANRRGSHEHTSFTFLGFTFRARRARARNGTLFASFQPAISKDALNKISGEVRRWRLHRRTGLTMGQLARETNPVVRGSPGVLSMSHDVAPVHPTESFCNTSRGCGARCRRCSEARPARTCHMHDNLAGRRRADYAAAICTIRPYARFAPVCPPENRGWMQYYGAFYRSALYPVLQRINAYLMRWLRDKYKRLRPMKKAKAAWQRVTSQYPLLFAHWAWAQHHVLRGMAASVKLPFSFAWCRYRLMLWHWCRCGLFRGVRWPRERSCRPVGDRPPGRAR